MKVSRAPDVLEASQLRHTAEHDPGYALIVARIRREIEQTGRDLVSADCWEKTQRLQERYRTLEMVLTLPRLLLNEAKNDPRRTR